MARPLLYYQVRIIGVIYVTWKFIMIIIIWNYLLDKIIMIFLFYFEIIY